MNKQELIEAIRNLPLYCYGSTVIQRDVIALVEQLDEPVLDDTVNTVQIKSDYWETFHIPKEWLSHLKEDLQTLEDIVSLKTNSEKAKVSVSNNVLTVMFNWYQFTVELFISIEENKIKKIDMYLTVKDLRWLTLMGYQIDLHFSYNHINRVYNELKYNEPLNTLSQFNQMKEDEDDEND